MSRPCRVLVADDDPTVGLLMPLALPAPVYEVSVFADGLEAWLCFNKQPFDVALLDVEMPGMDGLALCEAIRGQFASATLLVLVSGRRDPAVLARADALGALWLGKPLDWGALRGWIGERMAV